MANSKQQAEPATALPTPEPAPSRAQADAGIRMAVLDHPDSHSEPELPLASASGEARRSKRAPLRVLLADDHVVVRAGICSLLESLDGVEVVAQASDGYEALRLIGEHAALAQAQGERRNIIDIAILDISMSGMNGLEAAARIVREHVPTRVMMLSMHDSGEYVKQALRAGASGYLLKEAGFNELELALRTVARGEIYLSPSASRHLASAYAHPQLAPESTRSASGGSNGEAVALTPRQQEILCLLAQGLSNGQIASRLAISIKTVETHRAQLQGRLGIFDIVGLVRYAIRHGFIEPL